MTIVLRALLIIISMVIFYLIISRIGKKRTQDSFNDASSNEICESIAELLPNPDPNDPIYRSELLQGVTFDYSLESLKALDDYLEIIRDDQLDDDHYLKIVLRIGSYTGEVARRNFNGNWQWISFDEMLGHNELFEDDDDQYLGNVYVIGDQSAQDNLAFPLGKVMKFIENGCEDSLYSFISVLKQLEENGFETKSLDLKSDEDNHQ